jgi:hypothetical protein
MLELVRKELFLLRFVQLLVYEKETIERCEGGMPQFNHFKNYIYYNLQVRGSMGPLQPSN